MYINKHNCIASIIRISVTLCLAFSLLIFQVNADVSVTTDETHLQSDPTYKKVASTDKIAMYADMENGYFALQNLKNGYLWYSVPKDPDADTITKGTVRSNIRSQLIVNYVDKEDEKTAAFTKSVNSYMSSVENGDIEVSEILNGIRVTYGFEEIDMTIPVEYILEDDRFVATVVFSEIDEGKTSYLVSLNVLPTLGAAATGEEGYLFYPDGSGALINFSEHTSLTEHISKKCYGEEKAVSNKTEKSTYEETVKMPVFGTVRSGGNALLGIVEQGDSIAEISAYCSTYSCGYNAVSSTASYRFWSEKLMFKGVSGIQKTLYRVSKNHTAQERYSVGYYMLEDSDANYVGMANRYRQYLMDKQGLKKKIISPTFNLTLYGSVGIDASFLGIHFTRIQKLTTYSQAKEIVGKLTENGFDSISVRYIGWQKSGITNDKLKNAATLSSKLGGKSDWNSLSSYLNDKEYDFFPEVKFLSFQKSGGGITTRKSAIRTMFDDIAKQVKYSPSVYKVLETEKPLYLLKYSLLDKAMNKILNKYDKTGVKNISVSEISEMLYSDFSENEAYREESYQSVIKALEKLQNGFNKVAITGGNMYAVPFATKVYDTPIYSSGNLNYDKDVPFYQIVLHGIVNLTTPSVMQSQDSITCLLKSVEAGCELQFAGISESATVLMNTEYDTLYNTKFSDWKDYAREWYSAYQPLLEKIYNQKIVGHKCLSDKVYQTDYENGISVIVNYGDTDYAPNGTTVCKAKYFAESGGIANE